MDPFEAKLSEIAAIRVGYQARGRIDEDPTGEYLLLRPQDLDSASKGFLCAAMPFSPALNPAAYLVSQNDILLQARGRSHRAYWIEAPLKNAIAANTFYIIRIREHADVLPGYLTWWLNQSRAQKYFTRHLSTSTIKFLSKSELRKTPIRIPPPDTQQKISELFHLWQREKELLKNRTEKKETLLHAVARTAAMRSMEKTK